MLRQRSGKNECLKSPDTVEKIGVLAVLMLSAKQASAASLHVGVVSGTNFASLRRFWAVAASWNCSVAPLGPRSRIICRPMYGSGQKLVVKRRALRRLAFRQEQQPE